MTTHQLKIWPEFFQPVVDGLKTFELRHEMDRHFEVGDHVVLEEFEKSGRLTGRKCKVEVLYCHRGLGLDEEFVCMSIKLVPMK